MDMEKLLHRDPIADRGISVVIPTRNRADSIESLVTAISHKLDQTSRGHEIIVVDDGSTDSTAEIVARVAALNRRLRLVHHERPEGYGPALHSGFKLVKYPLVLQVDDDHRDPADISRLLEEIDHVDVVCGYRPRGPAEWGRVAYGLYRYLVRLIFGVHVHDVDCGLRLFRRSALRRIPIQSRTRFANAEILAKATFMNMLVAEVPVTIAAANSGQPTGFQDSRRSLLQDAVLLFRRPQFCTPAATDDRTEPTPHAA